MEPWMGDFDHIPIGVILEGTLTIQTHDDQDPSFV